jgi:hypothetical protein
MRVSGDAVWREDIDSLAFIPGWHAGQCVVHRLAFRALIGPAPTPGDCLTFFLGHRAVFDAAARAKAELKGMPLDANFHLTSRDLKRVLPRDR